MHVTPRRFLEAITRSTETNSEEHKDALRTPEGLGGVNLLIQGSGVSVSRYVRYGHNAIKQKNKQHVPKLSSHTHIIIEHLRKANLR